MRLRILPEGKTHKNSRAKKKYIEKIQKYCAREIKAICHCRLNLNSTIKRMIALMRKQGIIEIKVKLEKDYIPEIQIKRGKVAVSKK